MITFPDYIIQLHEKYSHLFELAKDDGYFTKKGTPLRGVETPPGWKDIVERLLESIDWLCNNRRTIPNPEWDEFSPTASPKYIKGPVREVQIFQIKEKFGDLRCYITCPDDMLPDINLVIGGAIREASFTCMDCGELGRFPKSTSGWIGITCPSCKEKRKKEQKK